MGDTPAVHVESEPKAGGVRGFLHPVSGGVVLGLDWLLFGSNALSAFGLAWLTSVLGFLVAGGSVALAQRKLADERWRTSLLKGALGGFAVAVPFPLGGTALGGLVLAASGLDRWRKWLGR